LDWEEGQNAFKTEVGFGIFSRESASQYSDECFWYDDNDVSLIFDAPFKVSVFFNGLGTMLGGLNFLYSLMLWCRYIRRSTVRYIARVYIACAGCGLLTQSIFYSDMCSWDKCVLLPDGSEGNCLHSDCGVGRGALFSFFAILCWLIIAGLTLLILRQRSKSKKAEKKHREDYEETCIPSPSPSPTRKGGKRETEDKEPVIIPVATPVERTEEIDEEDRNHNATKIP
jgi:hypothetical protein